MNNLTEIIFIIDRSGSMHGLEADTIGGYNSFLKKQQDAEGEAIVTTVLFNNDMQVIHDRQDIREVRPLTAADYIPGGSTALLDAVGETIRQISRSQSLFRSTTPNQTVVVIITDGMENSSRRFRWSQVHAMIEEQKEKGWDFVFLGANIDAPEMAEKLGVGRAFASNYHADSLGTFSNYDTLEKTVRKVRCGLKVEEKDLDNIRRDFRRRR
ncbi:MAG: VWA domain-containing protein [Solobacterium sp.]|nr:VWA domain-containing protein [Solobacterium sp.]